MSPAKFTQAFLLLLVGLVLVGLAAVSSAWAQTYTVLYSFTGGADGGHPAARLTLDSAGNLYGTTLFQNTSGCNYYQGCGAVFKVDGSGNLTVLHSFTGGADGRNPYTGLTMDSAGNLYGGASSGGDLADCDGAGCGVVFELQSGSNFSVLYTFPGGADGAGPNLGLGLDPGGLTLDSTGNVYGAAGGGKVFHACADDGGCGVLFKLNPSGQETVLHTFSYGKNGNYPNGSLIRDAAGNLYGTTSAGGKGQRGIVFKLDAAGNETVLYTFKGEPDGSEPNGGLIQDAAGNLYGTTLWGGKGHCQGRSCGVVFKLDPSGNETLLYSFTGGADGGNPNDDLIMDAAGDLYGTTIVGGEGGEDSAGGVVFKLDPSGNETVLHTFWFWRNAWPRALGRSDHGFGRKPIRHNLFGQ